MKFLKKSGNQQFDAEVKEAIEESLPFSKPTDSVKRSVKEEGIILAFPL